MNGIRTTLDISLNDRDGVVSNYSQPARSFVKNFVDCLYCGFTGVATTVSSLTGVKRPTLWGWYYDTLPSRRVEGGLGFRCYSGAGGGAGILVGSGNTPFDIADVNLAEPIPHGDVPGSLYRGETILVPPAISPDGMSIAMAIVRDFANNSDVDVIVREVGLVGCPVYSEYTAKDYHLYSRDVLDTPVVVSPGRTLNVTVRIGTEL